MKTTIATLAIAALTFFAAAPQAEARHKNRVYVSGHTSCGSPIYQERYFVGYDRCGNPIWRTRIVRQPSYRPAPRYVAPCPPAYHHQAPVRYPRPYSGGSFVIQGGFCR